MKLAALRYLILYGIIAPARPLKGGDQPDFFVKLVSEIAVDQLTRTSYQTFEGVSDPNHPPVPVVWPCPYLVPFRPSYAKATEHTHNQNFVQSTCSYCPNSYMKFRQDWTKNG